MLIKGVRKRWDPQPVSVVVRRATFLEQAPFNGVPPRLANAFHLSGIPYTWQRGIVEPLS